MPTCAADSCVDSCFVAFWMVPEKRARSATASSTVCLSRVSSENSAATKKPLPTIMRRASRSRNHSRSDEAAPRGGEATDGRRGGQDGDAGFTPARTVTRHGGNPIPARGPAADAEPPPLRVHRQGGASRPATPNRRAASPPARDRAALLVPRGGLDAHDRAVGELLERARAGVGAGRADAGGDLVQQVLDAGTSGVDGHPPGRDPLLE